MTIENEELNEVLISRTQYSLLNQIRGLDQSAFYMVVAAKEYSNGFLLKGQHAVFGALVRDLYDEADMAPKSRVKTIHALIKKLEPDYEDF
jgi:hypothetical protein